MLYYCKGRVKHFEGLVSANETAYISFEGGVNHTTIQTQPRLLACDKHHPFCYIARPGISRRIYVADRVSTPKQSDPSHLPSPILSETSGRPVHTTTPETDTLHPGFAA
jgi:hypothetical protein